MGEPCRGVTWHFLRFPDIRTPDMLDLSARPIGATGWEIGPEGPPGPDGSRELSGTWCAVGRPIADHAERFRKRDVALGTALQMQ
jgi:hypothetical protein